MDENINNQNSSIPTSVWFTAFLLAQEEITNPKKDTKGHNYKYAQLDQVLAIIKPILASHGLGIIQTPSGNIVDGCLTLKTVIYHKSGERMVEEFQIPIPQGRNITQDFGSCLSYARRYSILSLFSLAQEDDDGLGSPKPKNDEETIQELCEARIVTLKIEDWANSVGYKPSEATMERNQRFLDTKPAKLKEKAQNWRKENG